MLVYDLLDLSLYIVYALKKLAYPFKNSRHMCLKIPKISSWKKIPKISILHLDQLHI